MDVHDKATRSFNMSRIRSRNTTPELRLRQVLWARGLRGYRLHRKLPGKPDIVYSRAKVAIFIDGCFWHGCPKCGDGRAPVTNTSYWNAKRIGNQERDKRRTRELRSMGWIVLRLWEHEVTKNPDRCVARIARLLR
ncbi:MAG: very short patch repair endonuclease [Acidobacteriota bacterium]|nr:very short patch repair endonuclease [Acidobacteriota bacterium]